MDIIAQQDSELMQENIRRAKGDEARRYNQAKHQAEMTAMYRTACKRSRKDTTGKYVGVNPMKAAMLRAIDRK